jgi:hypothetical protein
MDSVQSIARAQQAGRVTAAGEPFRLGSAVTPAVGEAGAPRAAAGAGTRRPGRTFQF